jgi:hypothetical protein
MVMVWGVERNKCEHRGCTKKPTHIIITGINVGCNSWVYCKKHFLIHEKYFKDEDKQPLVKK